MTVNADAADVPKELEINLVALLRCMLRRKVLFASVMALAFGLGYAAFKLLPTRYEAHVSFAFQDQSGGASRLQQLAALTGNFSMRPKGSPFISHLETFSKTREVTSSVKNLQFRDSTLQQILLRNKDGKETPLRDTAHSFHSRLVSLYELSKKDDVYKLSAEHEDPEMALFLARNIFANIRGLLEEKRREGIKKKLEFIETLVNGYRLQYENASNRLRKFQMENRNVSSPDLVQQNGQLLLQVKFDEEKYLMSVKEREEFRIEYQQNEEPLVVLEDAYKPLDPIFPSLIKCIIAALALGFLLFLVLVGLLDRRKWMTVA